jgi:hypothetical protein
MTERGRKPGSSPELTHEDDRSALRAIVPYIQIEALRMAGGSFAVWADGTLSTDPLSASVSHSFDAESRRLTCIVEFTFQAKAPVAKQPNVRVDASYVLTYKLAEQFVPQERSFLAFARQNASYNAWPYWREFLQCSLQRLELPPLVLPLVRSTASGPSTSKRSKSRKR